MKTGICTRALGLAFATLGLAALSPAQWLENPPRFPAPVYNGMNSVSFNLPAVQIGASNLRMQVLSGRVPLPGPGASIDSFFDVFTDIDLNVNGTTGHGTATGHGLARAMSTGGGNFDTEMLSLDLQGNSPFGPFMIRESPTRASLGRTSVVPEGSTFRIGSFFDIFTELSVDGGQTWVPSSSDNQNGAMRINGSPEPASMIALGLGAVGLISRRRKK